MKNTTTESNLILPKIINLEKETSEAKEKYLKSVQDLQKEICTFLIENLKTLIPIKNLENKITPYSSMDSWKFCILTTEKMKFSTHQILFAVRNNSDVKFRLYENDQQPSGLHPVWRKLTLQDLKSKNYVELADIEDEWISTEKLGLFLGYLSVFIEDHQYSEKIYVQ